MSPNLPFHGFSIYLLTIPQYFVVVVVVLFFPSRSHFCPGIRFNNTSIATCWHGQKWDGDASYCISLNKLALKVSKNIQHTWLAKIGI